MSRFYSLSRDGDSGTQYIGATVVSSSFYSLSRDGDSGTARPRHRGRVRGPVLLFAVARWGQRNRWGRPCPDCPRCVSIRCREMGTAEHLRRQRPSSPAHRVSIRCREMGTAEPTTEGVKYVEKGFYSLSRGVDSGTRVTGDRAVLLGVSIRCREMGTAEHRMNNVEFRLTREGFYSLSRDGDSGTHDAVRVSRTTVRFLFAVARWGQRNVGMPSVRRATSVSIRCREMGTAELAYIVSAILYKTFLFAVARWGQRNCTGGKATRLRFRFLFAVARWGQRNASTTPCGWVSSVPFLFAVARWGQRNEQDGQGDGQPRGFYSLSRDGDSGTIVHASDPVTDLRFYSLSRDGDSGTSSATRPR